MDLQLIELSRRSSQPQGCARRRPQYFRAIPSSTGIHHQKVCADVRPDRRWVTRGPNAQFVFTRRASTHQSGHQAPAGPVRALACSTGGPQYQRQAASLADRMTEEIDQMLKKPQGFFLHREPGHRPRPPCPATPSAPSRRRRTGKAVKKAYEMTDRDPDPGLPPTIACSSPATASRQASSASPRKYRTSTTAQPVDGRRRHATPPGLCQWSRRGQRRACRSGRVDIPRSAPCSRPSCRWVPKPMPANVAIYASPQGPAVRGTMEQNWIYHVMKEAFDF